MRTTNSFVYAILALGGGTALGHALTLAAMPVITRLYDPAELGGFAVYLALANVVGVAASLRYEMALVLPKSDRAALHLRRLCILLVAAASVLVAGLVATAGDTVAALFDGRAVASVLWLLPLAVLARGAYQTLNLWSTRLGAMQAIAGSRIAQQATMAGTQIAIGLVSSLGAIGLALGHLAGLATAGGFLIARAWTSRETRPAPQVSLKRTAALASRYRKFPTFDTGAALLNISATEIPVLIVGLFFPEATVGLFALAMRVTAWPTMLATAAVGQAHYKQATDEHRASGTARRTMAISIKLLALTGVPAFAMLALIAPHASAWAFGAAWADAGTYIALLCPLFCSMFLVAPTSQTFFTYGRQEVLFAFQAAYAGIAVVSFLAAGWTGNLVFGLVLFSGLGTLRYIMMLLYLLQITGTGLRTVLTTPIFDRRPL